MSRRFLAVRYWRVSGFVLARVPEGRVAAMKGARPEFFDELAAHLAALPDREWRDDAACKGMDPLLFFPDHGVACKEARETCQPCPVRDDCLRDAVVTNEQYGIRGGMSDRERRPVRRALVIAYPELFPPLVGFARTNFLAAL